MEMTSSPSMPELVSKKILFTAYTLNGGKEEILFHFEVVFTPHDSAEYATQIKASKDTIVLAKELGANVRMKGCQYIINDICGKPKHEMTFKVSLNEGAPSTKINNTSGVLNLPGGAQAKFQVSKSHN